MKVKKANTLQIIINIGVWIFVFALPFLMLSRNTEIDYMRIVRNHGASVIASAFVFYLNYFYLTEKYLFPRKIGKFIILNLILVVGIGLLLYVLKESWPHEPPPPHDPRPEAVRRFWFIMREVFTMIMMSGFSIMVKVLSKWYIIDAQRQEEENRRKEAELLNLRQQINPHFFFNTLNNIYALIAISPEKAQNTVLELSKLMRYVLYDNSHNFVEIRKELDFIRNYIELMRIRLTENVEVKTDIQEVQSPERLIAPMIFITLIENAFKHGVSHTSHSFIHIDIHQVEERIVCVISNSYFPKDESDKSGSGIGLENLHRRLDILYPHQHIFRTEEKDHVYTCELVVPLK